MLCLAVTYMCFVYIVVSTIQLHINGYQGLFPSWSGEYYCLHLSPVVKIVWGSTSISPQFSTQTTLPLCVLFCLYSLYTALSLYNLKLPQFYWLWQLLPCVI